MTLLQFEDWRRPVNVGAIPNIQTMIAKGVCHKYLASPYSMGAVDLRPGYSHNGARNIWMKIQQLEL